MGSTALRTATQSLTRLGGYRRGEPIFDVIDELVFDDEAAARGWLTQPRVGALWAARLLDPQSIVTLLVAEHVAKPGAIPDPAVKNFEFVNQRGDLDRAEFDRYWIEVHGPLAAQIPQIRRYVQSHVLPSSYTGAMVPRFDGLALTWFDDLAQMRASAVTDEYVRTRADEANFLSPGDLPFIIATERVTYP
jgi:uncharacterized protein (TIGR02118 family)